MESCENYNHYIMESFEKYNHYTMKACENNSNYTMEACEKYKCNGYSLHKLPIRRGFAPGFVNYKNGPLDS
jgi:hypothetical protein